MELLAYIPAESTYDYNAIASDSNANENITTVDPLLRNLLKNISTKSVQLSLSTILAGTTVLVGLGSTLSVLAAVSPSASVEYVQSLLAKNGFDPGAVDGVAGTATKNAILRAQKSLGLPMDGVAGSQTIAALEGNKAVTPEVAQQPITADSSAVVMNLQKLLADRGFYNGAIDGIMGERTRTAIISAQKAYNLTADGVAGEQTLAALESDRAVVATNSTPTTATKNADTARLQELLSDRGFYNGAIDGIMGAQTRTAIIAAQKSYGLATDGIAGAKTIAALESGASLVNTANSNATNSATTTPASSTASNQDVAALQELLARRGFYKGAIDGVRGSKTNAAIAEAQKAYGLTVDSIAGAQTIAALERDARPAATPSTFTTPSNSDNSVANLQNLLTDRGFYNGPITGFLGSRTRDAIIAAQKAYGLTADGIAGTRTIAALESGAPQTQVATIRPIPSTPVTPAPPVEAAPIRVVPIPQTPQPTVVQPVPVQPQAATPKPTVVKPTPQPTPQATVVKPTTAPQVAAVPQVSELQQLLARRGFYTGKPDGVLNAETKNAIVRAQNFYTISPADGSPSSKLIDSLSKDTFISDGN